MCDLEREYDWTPEIMSSAGVLTDQTTAGGQRSIVKRKEVEMSKRDARYRLQPGRSSTQGPRDNERWSFVKNATCSSQKLITERAGISENHTLRENDLYCLIIYFDVLTAEVIKAYGKKIYQTYNARDSTEQLDEIFYLYLIYFDVTLYDHAIVICILVLHI